MNLFFFLFFFNSCASFLLYILRYLQCDLDMFDLDDLECKFDVLYIDPPLEEYQRRAAGTTFNWKPWTWDEVSCMPTFVKL